MPFDLDRAAKSLRTRHGEPMAFRQALLDLLFAAGCPVREQAVALEHGDAVCVRTSGPAAPVGDRPLVLVALDLEPPAPLQTGKPPVWPPELQPLGGPAVPIGFAAALQSLLASPRQRPWELMLVRGPALGTGEYVASLLQNLGPEAEVVHLVPVTAAPEPSQRQGAIPTGPAALDLVRLQILRPRNIWRFPACDHAYAVTVTGDSPLPRLRAFLAERVASLAWTLHDLRLQPGGSARLSAVLRTAGPLQGTGEISLREIDTEQRLLFPINDTLTALQQVVRQLPETLGEGLLDPLAAEVLPDGLVLHALVPPVPDDAELPDRAGTLALGWQIEPLVRPTEATEVPLAVTRDEARGPVPAGVKAQAVWRLPSLQGDEDLTALRRALDAHLR